MAAIAKAPSKDGQVFVARQPILNRDRLVYGYELLFRAAPAADAPSASADHNAARVISDALIAIGLDTLTDGRRAFVNVSRRLLLGGIPNVLPPERVVLELGADIEADRDVLDACRELRKAGYAIAIDDFVPNEWTADLVPLADFIKVDFPAIVDPDVRSRIVAMQSQAGPTVIAKKIEMMDTFEQAMKEGYTYFQGFFFGRPLISQGREVPGQQVANLRLMRALYDPELTVHQLEELIKHDASLCYRILRTVNSASYMLQQPVQSIRQALVLLGRDTVRRWASLWALAGLSEKAHSELVIMSTVRGRCCELLAGRLGGNETAGEGFLAGMCSLLDAILERPMKDILKDLPLAQETEAALLGGDNATRRLIDCVIAYENGQWDRCVQLAKAAGADPAQLPTAYTQALTWSRELRGELQTAAAH
jgi:EAL and modified HD-GYP domain-containing signal transduction protein